MFSGCSKFNADISLWKTHRNEDMAHMFSGCTKFNSNLAFWDVSKVVDMEGLFAGASTFNKPIGYWDTSNVTKCHTCSKTPSHLTKTFQNGTLTPLRMIILRTCLPELSRLTGSGHARNRGKPAGYVRTERALLFQRPW